MNDATTTELNAVLFPNPDAQLRYLRRLEERYHTEFMASNPRTFETAQRRLEAVETAIRNFSPVAHMEAVRARNMAG
jgi:hypothetical protein